jgi:dienelactone hydrolase
VLRFNFPRCRAQRRIIHGRRRREGDFKAALDYMQRAPIRICTYGRPGFSFGRWIALETGAADDRVDGASSASRRR